MTRDEALKKIKKCLALSRSANEHEAAAALRHAQKLMQAFSLAEEDISLADVTEVRVKARSTAANRWELALVHLVADAFGCETFGSLKGAYNTAGSFTRTRHWVFVGIDTAPEVAGFAAEVLIRQCATARLAHIAKQPKNCKPITKTARGDAFAVGWVAGVAAKVEAFAQSGKNETLLLAYMQREHPDLADGKVRDTTKARRVDHGHIAAGYRAGKAAELHRGVGGNEERKAIA
jgi:hypothetical protein